MSSLRQEIDARAKMLKAKEGVLLYKVLGSYNNSIDKDLYLKQRESFLKNFKLLRTKYKIVSPESDLELDKINEFGYRETVKIDNYDPEYKTDIFVNFIPSLKDEEKAICSNYDNVKFLFFKYKCLSYITHTLNTVYSDTVKRSKFLKLIMISQLEGLISGFLDLYHPQSYLKINDEIVIGKSDDYLLLNRIDFWNDKEVENLETLYKVSNRFKVYDNGFIKAKNLISVDKCHELKGIEYISCNSMYYILRNSTGLYEDLIYETTKRSINEFEETVKSLLESYFNNNNFTFENNESPIKRISIYPLSNIINIIGEEHILKRIENGYKLHFKCGENYLIIEPELKGIDFHQHFKIFDHKLEHSNYCSVAFAVKSVKYEIEKEIKENNKIELKLEYEYNDDIKQIINNFLSMNNLNDASIGIDNKNESINIEKDKLCIFIKNNLTVENFKDLIRALVHLLQY